MWNFIRGRIGVFSIGILLCAAGLSQLHAQQSGTISGTVLDQTGKPIQDATVELKSESTGASRSVISDAEGKFLASDLAVGSYSIRVSAPGFALTTRSGGQVTAGATLDIPITMSVESVSTSVTVNETISLAAVTAPSGNTARGDFGQNRSQLGIHQEFHVAGGGLLRIRELCAGYVQPQSQWDRARPGQDVFPRFPGRTIHHDVRWDSVRRYQHADAPFLGELSERLDRRRRFRPQPRPRVDLRPHQLRRIDQYEVAAIISGPGHSRRPSATAP